MRLLVSDANIFIDMEEGGLLELMFKLPYEFCVPDVLFAGGSGDHCICRTFRCFSLVGMPAMAAPFVLTTWLFILAA